MIAQLAASLSRAVILVALTTGAAVAAPCAGFDDVDSSSPFCANVTWIKNRGITTGCAATLYCPDLPVTRLHMAAFLSRLEKYTGFFFTDANDQYIGRALGGLTSAHVEVELAGGEKVFALLARANTGFDFGRVLFYATPDCTGQVYGGTSSKGWGRRWLIGVTVSNVEMHFLSSDVSDNVVILSQYSNNSCVTVPNPQPAAAWYRAAPVTLPAFAPPFKLY